MAAPKMVVEFWVMRVLLHPGPMRHPVTMRNLPDNERPNAMALVKTGELCCLPDSCIAEPVEVFTDQLAADAHREKLAADMPSEDFRVVLNTNMEPS